MDNLAPHGADRFVRSENNYRTHNVEPSLVSGSYNAAPPQPSHDYTDRRDKKLMSIISSKNSRISRGTTSFQVTPPRAHCSDCGSLLRPDGSNAFSLPPFMRRLYRTAEEVVCRTCSNGSSNHGSGEATASTSQPSASSITTRPSQFPDWDTPPTSPRLSCPDNSGSREKPLNPSRPPSPLPINVTSEVAETRCSICGSSRSESSDKYDTSRSQQPYTDGGYGGGDCVFCNDKDEQIGIAI